ncbi:MAG: septum site-determining protein MinC [Cyanobacteriota bacterium]|nr:septum site-determining protein MinC [Cyanobacteriota bacterium]
MPAELIPSADREQPHLLKLPEWEMAGDLAAAVRDALLMEPDVHGPVTLISGLWPLRLGDFQQLMALLQGDSLSLVKVCCLEDGARVAAAALGLAVEGGNSLCNEDAANSSSPSPSPALAIHQGTLRSGDHRHASGSLLVLGDVNPGAQISARGHVMVWGRLRGIAHAGCAGDRSACIVALHLHPLQLRIADAVARGPAEGPPLGLAEKAHLVEGSIQIDPAEPFWPLGAVPAKLPGQGEGGRGSGLA